MTTITNHLKVENANVTGTSFHGQTFIASIKKLREILGEPTCEGNDGEDKVNIEWDRENSNGDVFTVYDWKEYRRIEEYEQIAWHIGAHNFAAAQQAHEDILKVLLYGN